MASAKYQAAADESICRQEFRSFPVNSIVSQLLLPFAHIGGIIDVIRDLIALDEVVAEQRDGLGDFIGFSFSLRAATGSEKSELEHRCTETFAY